MISLMIIKTSFSSKDNLHRKQVLWKQQNDNHQNVFELFQQEKIGKRRK